MQREDFIQFTTLVVFVATSVGLLLSLFDNSTTAVAGIVAVLAIAFSFKFPKIALWTFLIYLPFAGTVTYAIDERNALLQLIKDFFYVPALIALIIHTRRAQLSISTPKSLIVTLRILLGICLLTLLAVNGVQQLTTQFTEMPVLMGLMGLKVLMGYIPLIFCASYLIRNKQALLFLTRVHVVLILICCILSFIQYQLLAMGVCEGTPDSIGEDLFKATSEARCFVGGALVYSPETGIIRLPGTFVAPWQWAWFLIFSCFLSFASARSDPSFIWQLASFAAIAAVFISAEISGHSIALFFMSLSLIVLLLLTFKSKQLIKIGLGLVALVGILIISNFAVSQEQFNNLVQTYPSDLIVSQFQWVMGKLQGLLGNGLGRATHPARLFGYTQLIETYYPKLLYEIGVLGVLAFLSVVCTLLVLTFRAYRSVGDIRLRRWGICLWLFLLLISCNSYHYPLDVDPVAVYYWFFAGVLLQLPELDQPEPHQEQLG